MDANGKKNDCLKLRIFKGEKNVTMDELIGQELTGADEEELAFAGWHGLFGGLLNGKAFD